MGSVTFDVFMFAEESQRFVSGIQSHLDDLRAFGYEYALAGIEAVAQLGVGQGAE